MAWKSSAKRIVRFLVLVCLLAPLLAAEGVRGGEPERKPVAVVLGEAVYEEDLGPPAGFGGPPP